MSEPVLTKLGRYEIVRELGRGAMGVVYEGHDPVVDRRVAIKTARRDVLEGSSHADELMERFLREARAAGALSHPNIVTVYDAGEEGGTAYIAMEYLDGTDLQKLLDAKRRFTVEQVVEVMSTLCGALGHAHDHGIVHRDIKPSNVVLLSNGLIKVADFGIARVSDSHLTQEGSMIGTPHYMSPEQFMGHPVDARSDLFSAGVIIYELLTGERPFHGNSLSAVMHNVLHSDPVPPRQLNFAVGECLSRVVLKALAKEPARRYQSAGEMCAALRECLRDRPDPAVTLVDAVDPAVCLAATVTLSSEAATVVTNGTAAEPPAEPPTAAPVAAPSSDKRLSLHATGRRIRARREERGLTLEQAYELTRLPERYLLALESGDLDAFEGVEWPRVAETIRTYCGKLELPAEPILASYEAAFARAQRPARRFTPKRMAVAGAAGLLAALGAFAALAPFHKEPPAAGIYEQAPAGLSDYYLQIALSVDLLDLKKDEDSPDAGSVDVEVQEKSEDGAYRTVQSGRMQDDGVVVIYRKLNDPRLVISKPGYEPSEKYPAPEQDGNRDISDQATLTAK